MTKFTEDQETRIAGLARRVRTIACGLVGRGLTSAELEDRVSDLEGEMWLYLVDRAAREPSFLDQTDAYIAQACEWRARDYARRERHGLKLIPLSLDDSPEDPMCLLDVIGTEDPPISLSIDVAQALDNLGDVARRVAVMIAAGWRNVDIAQELGVRPATVFYYRGQIRQALASVGYG